MVFKVKGSDGTKVGLFTEALTNLTGVTIYEVAVGGWGKTKQVLRKQHLSNDHTVYSSSSFANPTYSNVTFTTFWLSWKDHVISLGYGDHIGKNTSFAYNDTDSPIEVNYLGFSSYWGNWNTFFYHNGKLTLQSFPWERVGFPEKNLSSQLNHWDVTESSPGKGHGELILRTFIWLTVYSQDEFAVSLV